MFRENVVHGMLPLAFLSLVKSYHLSGSQWTIGKISAQFLKPVYIRDQFILNSKISEVREQGHEVELEYLVQKSKTQTILTRGNMVFYYHHDAPSNQQGLGPRPTDSIDSLVKDALVEQNLFFDDIPKGYEKVFDFLISRSHAFKLYDLLQEGLLSDGSINPMDRFEPNNLASFLSTFLCSTFVGMCIPGKNATFMNLNLKYHKPLQWEKAYIFRGNVEFKSPLTSTIIENIFIEEKGYGPMAEGKIDVRVSDPHHPIPSVADLKKKATDLGIRDKVVLITGSSRNIGEMTAKLFAAYGAKVVVNYFRGREDAEKIVQDIVEQGGEAMAFPADVSDREQVKTMILSVLEHYGAIDILINNAVKDFTPVPFTDLTWEDFQKDINVVVKGAFNCCQEILPLMVANKWGRIINISSVAVENPPPQQTKYVVSKSALVGLTRSLAIEYAPHNIQINAVVPSLVATDLTKHVPKGIFEGMKSEIPMKRNATPLDVAKAIIFLSSSLASFTTGQKIMVTGGGQPLL